MKRIKNLCMIFALVFGAVGTGCAADPVDADGDGDGGGEGGGETEEEETARPLDAAGKYHLQSKLDLAASVPGTAGEVVNTIIAITDDPEDPTLWIVDQALAAMPSGWIKSALQSAKPYVVGYLNDRLLELAPEFVPMAVGLANNLGQMATGFGLNETLEVTGAPGAYTSKLTVVGAHFTVDGVESDHAFSDHGAPEIVAGSVGVTFDAGKLGIGEHRFALSYGAMLRIGLDAAIIPMIEPDARSLNELLAAKVNCTRIGQLIAAVTPVGSAGEYAGYCTAGLNRAANYAYEQIATVDGVALEFGKTGAAKAVDKNKDGSLDTIHTGAWTGTVGHGGAAAPLASATFFGARM